MRKFVLVLAAMAGLVLFAGPAYAHVAVDPSTANQGGDATFTFTVPNETDNANTIQVEIDLPAANPIGTVSVEPVPGWTVNVEKTTLAKPVTTDDGQVTEAVSKITWSGGTIKPGEFQQFPVSMGPLPDTKEIVFKALQTYSDGTVVRWIETASAGGAEPEHPAPVVTLEKVAEGSDHHAAASDTETASGTKSSDDSSSDTLAIVAIVIGALGVILGGVALVRGGRAKTT